MARSFELGPVMGTTMSLLDEAAVEVRRCPQGAALAPRVQRSRERHRDGGAVEIREACNQIDLPRVEGSEPTVWPLVR